MLALLPKQKNSDCQETFWRMCKLNHEHSQKKNMTNDPVVRNEKVPLFGLGIPCEAKFPLLLQKPN